jgi:hypothetical protein
MCSSDTIVSVLSGDGLPLGTAATVGATPLSVCSRLRAAAHLAFISYSSLFIRSPLLPSVIRRTAGAPGILVCGY